MSGVNQHYEREMRLLSENQSKKYWENMNQKITGTEMISISKEYYQILLDDQRFLNCLEAYGVDNWDGYACACADYRKNSNE